MINWKQLPFLRLLVPFIVGIVLALYFDKNLSWLLYLIVTYFIGLVVWFFRPILKTRFSFGYISQLFLLLFGYYLTYQFHAERCPNYLISDANSPTYFTGIIDDLPQQKKWVKLIIRLENAGSHLDSLHLGCGQLLAYVEPDSLDSSLAYGDKIIFEGKPQRIALPQNPAAFDQRAFYFKENIHHQIFIKKDKWQLIERKAGNPFYTTIFAWRMRFVDMLREHLPKATDFSVASALILGYKNEMNHEIREAYAKTGATHVLAVSGLHVGLVVWLVLLLLNRIKIYHPVWRFLKAAILILLIGTFVFLTGAPPSVCRAALLFSLVLVGKEVFRRYDSFNLLAVSACILLTFNPYFLLDVGFQLSYLAMGGILYFQPRIYQCLYFKSKWADKTWQLLSVSLAAQLMTLPISIYYFHQIPLYFWLSSLVVIPAAGFILGLGFLLFFSTALSASLGSWVGALLGWLISLVNGFIFLLESIPFNLIEGLWWSGTTVVLLYFIIFALTVAANKREVSFQWLQISLVALVVLASSYAYRKFEIHQQRKIVIYHTPRHSLVDCIEQHQTFALHSEDLDRQTIGFNAKNYRQSQQVKRVNNIPFTATEFTAEKTFRYHPNVMQFYNQQMIIIDRPLRKNVESKLKTDYILVLNSPKLDMIEVVQHFDFQQIIFDSSNKFWQIERWKKQCEDLNLNCYDISKQGAWIKEIEF
ncbi:MAG: ComEC/Rec2 family competence protein [Saprospiraceae bacterium]